VYAISDRKERALKIEVKTIQQGNFVTNITRKGLDKDPHAPDFWVLFQIRPDQNAGFKERFFVLTHEEICRVQKVRNQAFAKEHFARHGKQFDFSKGVDGVRVADVEPYENKWSKIVSRLSSPAAA
jgi:hypothetical protein